jgi:hypothetical protein
LIAGHGPINLASHNVDERHSLRGYSVFGFFSKTSNKDIEAVVRRTLEKYFNDGNIQAAVLELVRFADQRELGACKRARFAAEVTAYASQEEFEPRQALALGDAFGIFVHRRHDHTNLHWKAYAAGVEGAIRYQGEWGLESSRGAGALLVDYYILNPADRTRILQAYELGWTACGITRVAKEAALDLKRTCASVASPGLDSPEEIQAWRSGEITTAAENAYRRKRQAELLAEQAPG